MSRLGQELVESAREALAIANGTLKPARVVEVEAADIDVAAIRKRLDRADETEPNKSGV